MRSRTLRAAHHQQVVTSTFAESGIFNTDTLVTLLKATALSSPYVCCLIDDNKYVREIVHGCTLCGMSLHSLSHSCTNAYIQQECMDENSSCTISPNNPDAALQTYTPSMLLKRKHWSASWATRTVCYWGQKSDEYTQIQHQLLLGKPR